jgi:hypothetical protein
MEQKIKLKLGTVVYTYNPRIWEAEARGASFEASMGSTARTCLKKLRVGDVVQW